MSRTEMDSAVTSPTSRSHQDLPLERLKTEAERWVPYIAEERGDSLGNASRGLRDIVQRAYDLGCANSETERNADTITIPLETARLVRQACLPVNPNKCRGWHPDLLAAVRAFIAAVEAASVTKR